MTLVFWASLVLLAYIWAGYPLVIALLAKILPNPVRSAEHRLSMSVVIAAHNEAARIADKIRSLLASDVAQDIVEILVASDGSTDGTPAAVAAVGDPRVRCVALPERRGKASALNLLVPQCRADVLVFTDARQAVAPDALGRLVRCLADTRVGVVSGELVFFSNTATGAARGMSAYWSYEKFIRACESRFRSVPGATGALYAMRRALFQPLPADTLLDDVVLPMQAVVQGSRCVLESGALVFDEPSATAGQEAVRKRRTLAGNAQLALTRPQWLLPWRNPIWFEFVSHKMARLASPFLLLALLLSGWFLRGRPAYDVGWFAQLIFYVISAAGGLAERAGGRLGWLGVPWMFVALNATTLRAIVDILLGRPKAAWSRAQGA